MGKADKFWQRIWGIMEYMQGYQRRNGYCASAREIINNSGAKSTSTVTYYMRRAQELDWIRRGSRGQGRSDVITPLGREMLTLRNVERATRIRNIKGHMPRVWAQIYLREAARDVAAIGVLD